MALLNEEVVRALAGVDTGGYPVVSCYLDVDGRRYTSNLDVQAQLDQLVRQIRASGSGPAPADADLDRVRAHARGFDRKGVRGLAMFSCQARDLWQEFALPVRFVPQLVVNGRPAVFQLEDVLDEYERFGLLLADRERARMFVYELGALKEHTEQYDPLVRKGLDNRGEMVKTRVESQKAEQVHQHVKRAAELAFSVYKDEAFDRLLLGGPPEILSDLEAALHPYLRDRLGGRVKVGVASAPEEVRVAAMAAEEQAERRTEAELVALLKEEAGAGGRGVAGLKATLMALNEQRADRLFVSHGYVQEGWQCPNCGILAPIGPTCPGCAKSMTRLADVVEEAVHVALRQNCRVEVCQNADLDVLGRIGALLRYA